MDRDQAFKTIKEKGIEYIGLMFTDALGKFYALWASSSEVEAEWEMGIGASGFPIFTEHENSDIRLKPDMGSFRVLPWMINGRNIGVVICDIYHGEDQKEFKEAPRSLLKGALKKLKKELGDHVGLYGAPEHEFYVLERNEEGELCFHDQGRLLRSTSCGQKPRIAR